MVCCSAPWSWSVIAGFACLRLLLLEPYCENHGQIHHWKHIWLYTRSRSWPIKLCWKLCDDTLFFNEIAWLHLHPLLFHERANVCKLFLKSTQFIATVYIGKVYEQFVVLFSLCPGCLAARLAVNQVPLAPLTLVNAHRHWAVLMAHWRGRPAWIHPPQEQVVWAAWVGKAEAAARCTAKRPTWALTPPPLVRRQASLCPLTPGLGLRTSAVPLRAVKTHWAATVWPVYTQAQSP